MNSTMKVLVTGAGALLGQGIIRSLAASTLAPTIVAADPSPLSAGLYWAPARYRIPMAKDPDYMAQIERILEIERPDAVMVGTDVELHAFAAARADLEQRFNTHVIVSDARVVGIADDKYLTYEFMRDHGFAPPESRLPGGEDELVERFGFPLIVKPRIGARSVGVNLVRNRDELARAIASLPGMVIQECVGTDAVEFTAGTLTFDGVCGASIVMRRDLRDGNTHRAYVEAFPELDAQVREMATKLRAYGPANFQFRTHEGRARVFEINGRFSGTTPLRMRAGFNEVEMVLRHVVLGEQISQPEIQPMTILRHMEETVVRAGELLK